MQILCSFFFFHFPTKICASFSSLKTSAIELKLQYNVQNGLNSRSITFSIIWSKATNYSSSKMRWNIWARQSANCCLFTYLLTKYRIVIATFSQYCVLVPVETNCALWIFSTYTCLQSRHLLIWIGMWNFISTASLTETNRRVYWQHWASEWLRTRAVKSGPRGLRADGETTNNQLVVIGYFIHLYFIITIIIIIAITIIIKCDRGIYR